MTMTKLKHGWHASVDDTVRANEGLVLQQADKWARADSDDFDDLCQEGRLGVMRAHRTYDPARGKFSTYALPWIRQCMIRWLQRNSTIYVPTNVVQAIVRKKEKTTDRKATPELIAAGVRARATMLDIDYRRPENPNTLVMEFSMELADASNADPAVAIDSARYVAKLHAAIERLPEARLRYIVRERYGLGNGEPKTLETIAGPLNLSRERVRQLTDIALRTMKHDLSKNGMDACSLAS